jgi:hypothetical protein
MAKIQSFKRIIAEDYDEKDRPLVEKLSNSINSFAQDVQDALNKQLSFKDNFNITTTTLTALVDANGKPLAKTAMKTGLVGQCVGVQVIRVANLTNSTSYPSGTPFVSYSNNNDAIIITHISNLVANHKYQLTLILYS